MMRSTRIFADFFDISDQHGRAVKRLLMGFTAMTSLAIAAPAGVLAQDTAEGSGDEADDTIIFETITVTAQKRTESILDVPLAVSAISGEIINARNYTRLDDIVRLTPNFNIEQAQDARFLRLSIRGISADTRFPGAEQSVSVVMDGVTLNGAAGILFDLVDIEQVEVLRGPQGTLFGRNASAGVINVRTRRPDEEYSARGSVELGNFDHIAARGAFSGPVIEDKLFASVGVSHTQRSGYATNPFSLSVDPNTEREVDDQNTTTIRGSLLWTPADDWEVFVTGDYTSEDRVPSALDGLGDTDAFDRVIAMDTANRAEREILGLSATVSASFPDAGIAAKLITGYREYTVDETLDGDFTSTFRVERNNEEESEEFTMEFQILSENDSPLQWIAGAFLLEQDLVNEGVYPVNSESFVPPPFSYRGFLDFLSPGFGDAICTLPAPECLGVQVPFVTFDLGIRSIAGFGQLTYAVTDRLDLTLGGRYSSDDRDYSYGATGEAVFLRGLLPTPSIGVFPTQSTSRNDKDFSWRVAANYSLNDNMSVYGSVSTGYKAGAFATQILPTVEEFDGIGVESEESTNYEIGLKAATGKVSFSASAFFIDYSRFQTDRQVINIADPDGVSTVLGNADLETYGFEMEGSAELLTGVNLIGAVGYVHNEFTDYDNCSVVPGTNPADPEFIDCDGNELPFAPNWTASLNLDFFQPVADNVAILGFFGGSYKSRQFFTPVNTEVESQDGYVVLNGQIGLDFQDGRIQAFLYGRNITNEDFAIFAAPSTVTADGRAVTLGAPRTWGFRLAYNF